MLVLAKCGMKSQPFRMVVGLNRFRRRKTITFNVVFKYSVGTILAISTKYGHEISFKGLSLALGDI